MLRARQVAWGRGTFLQHFYKTFFKEINYQVAPPPPTPLFGSMKIVVKTLKLTMKLKYTTPPPPSPLTDWDFDDRQNYRMILSPF